MPWNWELPNWPKFKYNSESIAQKERAFLLNAGSEVAFLKNIPEQDFNQFVVEILSIEGIESAKIEGEILNRASVQSSIKRHFGLIEIKKQETNKEAGMAKLLCNVYETFDDPLSHEMLLKWHALLFENHPKATEHGTYRTHLEPMQIISNRYDAPKVFFEAPPSLKVYKEMDAFIDWFNATRASKPILERAAIAHVYFESIHPFEDGNGRIGRVLVEKILSQAIGQPVLIAISKILEKRKKNYYSALEKCNSTLDIQQWIEFFADVILEGQKETMQLLTFLIEKSKMMIALAGQLNERQEKALLKMFMQGVSGFKGGLSAEKYIAITKASRATATRDLADLVQKGALVKTGELRHTRYWLNIAS